MYDISVLHWENHFFQENFLWIIVGVILMLWSFGSYQAFASLFIAMTLVSFIMCFQKQENGFLKSKLREQKNS